jgi:hypothetical protein
MEVNIIFWGWYITPFSCIIREKEGHSDTNEDHGLALIDNTTLYVRLDRRGAELNSKAMQCGLFLKAKDPLYLFV